MGGLKSKDAFERDLEYSLVDAISFDDDDLFDDIAAVYLDSKLRRYLCRPSRYLKHRERDFKDRIDRLHREPDEGFRKFMRINKLEFNYLLTTLQDHPIFKSTGKRPQAVPKYQITVAIWRLGHDGTGASAVCINQHFHIAEGTCNIWTDRFIYALLDLEDEVILWPDKLERREIADQIAAAGVPGGCVVMVACVILHNLFISTSFDFYTEEEAKQAARREELEQQQRSSMDPHHRQDEAVYHPARLAVMHLMGLQKSIKPKKKKKNQTIVLPPGINLIDYIHPNLVLPITNVDCS
ncbi:uncharacterized protein I206_101776 [Kwoniella pini CBS 10737]|uniref:Uncharacterized protein n=1 Tax=Kwoniella pini CBS 10737 TaxID=1296096 RepID=A0AAJ8L0E8_9TREE